MKSFKLSNIPILIVLFISCTASLLMGCSGGGGAGGSEDQPAERLGPETLAAGMVFEFSGDYINRSGGGIGGWVGAVRKDLTVTSPTSGSWDDIWANDSGDSGLTYTRPSTGNKANLVATTYPFASAGPQVGTVKVILTFTTETSGTFTEDGITDSGYEAEGSFLFTDASALGTSTPGTVQ